PLTPITRRNCECVNVKLVQKTTARYPATADRRIHQLHETSVLAPGNYEVRHAAWVHHDDDCGKCFSGREQHMIDRDHDLLCAKAELCADVLERVYRGAVNISLASFAQTTITHRNTPAFEHGFERRRPTVHHRSLDHLGNYQATFQVFSSRKNE